MSQPLIVNRASDQRVVMFRFYRAPYLVDTEGRTISPSRARVIFDSGVWLSTTVWGAVLPAGDSEGVVYFADDLPERGTMLTDAPAWVQELSVPPGGRPDVGQQPWGSRSRGEVQKLAARFAAEMRTMPVSPAQQRTMLLRQSLLMHGVPQPGEEMQDDGPLMQALAELPDEVVDAIVRWIWVSCEVGSDRGAELALKALRSRFETSSPQDEAVVGSINVLLREMGMPLQP